MTDLDTRQSEKGLSLLEIAIALIVVGLLITPMLQMYNINKMERVSRENNKTLENIAIALNKYAQQNKKYPVPANPTLPSTDTFYGTPATITASDACAGIFVSQGVRCFGGTTPNTSPVNQVLAGTVPFLELGLNEKDIYDIYGSKISYVVTRQLTVNNTANPDDPNAFVNGAGAIAIIDQDNAPIGVKLTNKDTPTLIYNDPDTESQISNADTYDGSNNRVMFALISHGEDRKGAWQGDSTLSACTNPGLDTSNCNQTSMTATLRGRSKKDVITIKDPANPLATVQAELTSPSRSFAKPEGANHYDDTIVYRTTSRDEGWSSLRSDVSDAEAGTFISESGTVMIKDDPSELTTAEASMDVGGAVKVYKTKSQTICNRKDGGTTTWNCFRTINISGKEPDPTDWVGSPNAAVKCNDMGGLQGFSKQNESEPNSAYIKRDCPTETKSPIPPSSCPTGMGISKLVNGVPQCS